MGKKVYILVRKENDDYSSLPPEYEKVFIFERIGNTPDIKGTKPKLELILDLAEPDDTIVFNGPTWLVALAGYIWLTQDNRVGLSTFIFDNSRKAYVHHNEDV